MPGCLAVMYLYIWELQLFYFHILWYLRKFEINIDQFNDNALYFVSTHKNQSYGEPSGYLEAIEIHPMPSFGGSQKTI